MSPLKPLYRISILRKGQAIAHQPGLMKSSIALTVILPYPQQIFAKHAPPRANR